MPHRLPRPAGPDLGVAMWSVLTAYDAQRPTSIGAVHLAASMRRRKSSPIGSCRVVMVGPNLRADTCTDVVAVSPNARCRTATRNAADCRTGHSRRCRRGDHGYGRGSLPVTGPARHRACCCERWCPRSGHMVGRAPGKRTSHRLSPHPLLAPLDHRVERERSWTRCGW